MTEEHEGPQEPEYGLLMPFVVVASKGGPYDDASFVAGARMKALWDRCELGIEDSFEVYEPTPLVPQLDLVAMQFGYRIDATPWWEAPEEWALVRFVKSAEGED